MPVGADPQKTISALYVFTDCEVVHSPNACVIRDNKPCFVDVIEMLKYSTQATEQLIKSELEIKLKELQASWHAATLERIFIEEKLYRIIEQSTTETDAIAQLHKALQPFRNLLHQDIHKEDIIRLIELKFRRLARYDVSRALQDIAKLEKDILDVNHHLTHLTNYTIQHFQTLKQKYSTGHERRTIAMQFDDIVASNVVVANEKLYINRLTGFIGYGLKDQELLGNCSTIDEVLVIYKNGQMKVSLVSDKAFFGKDIIYATILKKNDEVTTYNMAYTDGPAGFTYVKRFNVYGITRDKIYDLTQGTEGSTVRHWSVSPSEQEGPTIHAKLVATPGIRKTELSFDFATLAVKNRHAQGNILTKYAVKSIKT